MSERIDLLLKLHTEGRISDEALDEALKAINKPREEAPTEGVKGPGEMVTAAPT